MAKQSGNTMILDGEMLGSEELSLEMSVDIAYESCLQGVPRADDEAKGDVENGSESMLIISSEDAMEEFSFGSDVEGRLEDEGNEQVPQLSSGLRPFDMDLLMECIRKGEDVLCRVEQQDVVIVVGKTGTGKTTLIQGIAGKTFHESHHETQMYSNIVEKAVFDADDPLDGFETGHDQASMTKTINCFNRKAEH